MSIGAANEKIGDVQILRAVAIIFVLMYHLSLTPTVLSAFPSTVQMPFWIGVDLFFVVSGLVVTQSVFRGRLEAGRFLVKRLFRLWPAILAFLAVNFAVSAIVWQLPHDSWGYQHLAGPPTDFAKQAIGVLGGFFVNWSPTPNYMFGAMWSLSIEFQFYAAYAVWLALLALLRVRGEKARIATIWLAGAVYGLILAKRLGILFGVTILDLPPLSYMLTWRVDMMLLGVLVAFTPPVRKSWTYAVIPALFFLPLILVALSETPYQPRPVQLLDGLAMTVTGICFALIGLFAKADLAFHGHGTRLYSALCWIGDRSYSIYLLHFPIMALQWLLFFWFAPELFYLGGFVYGFAQAIVVLPVTLLFAHLCFTYVELPGQQLGKLLLRRYRRDPLPQRA